MGLFRSKTATRVLEDDLWALKKRVGDLESENKRLALDFEQLYDKVRHQMARMSRRAKAAQDETSTDPLNDGDNSASDGLDPISRSIMARRGMGAVKR